MKGSNFGYLCKQGFKNIRLNRVLSLASVSILTVCLLLVGLSVLFSENVSVAIGGLTDNSLVAVEVSDEATEETKSALLTLIETNDNTEDVEYIPKAEGLEQFKESLSDNAGLLDALEDDNPLPDMIRFQVKHLERMPETVAYVTSLEGVASVQSTSELSRALVNIKNIVTACCTVIVAVLSIVSLVIISNVIRASIFARRKEVNIMKFVGATNTFIRFPFFIEGILIGLIAALVAFGLTWGGYTLLLHYVQGGDSYSWFVNTFASLIPFENVWQQIALIYAAGGVAVGAIGTVTSIGSHLKV